MMFMPKGGARVSTPIETSRRNSRKHFRPLIRPILGLLLGFSFLWLGLPAISSNGLRVNVHVPFAPAQTNTDRKKVAADEGRKKIAAGEYEVYEEANEGLVGPFGEEVRKFHESWTLWQNAKRGYEVEGERRFESLQKGPQSHTFKVELSRDFTVERVTEFTSLRYVADSGPLTCEFLPKEMHCSPGGKHPNPEKDWHLAAEHPYGLLWPISPFSLGGVTKESERDPAQATRVSLLTIEQPGASEPVSPMLLVGKLQYLGVEDIEAAGRTWRAYKFSIKVPLHPQYLVWTSPKGLLLALSVEHAHADWPKEGLRLARYESFMDY
jgi:hypothetical protein